jgi:hypothetical protein
LPRACAIFEVIVGVASSLLLYSTFGGLAAMSKPVSLLYASLVWTGASVGPVLLIVGPWLLLAERKPRLGAILTLLGAIAWTFLAVIITVSILNDQHERGGDPWLRNVNIAVLCVAALVDWSAWVLWRFFHSGRIA